MKLALGVILASIAVFVWGFVYWAANPLPYSAWKQTEDDAAAGQAILEHFPESGTYFLPGIYNDEETMTRLHEAGPIAMIHLSREGGPVMRPLVLVKGFLLNLVTVILAALLLRLALPASASYADGVKLAALTGLAAAVFIDFGDVVWWYGSWDWKLHMAIYHVSFWLVAGLILAKFIRPQTAPSG